MNPLGLVKTFLSEDAVAKRRIVKFGSAEGAVALATGPAGVMGVSGIRGAAVGDPLDVYLSDDQSVECGGTFAAGDYITADGQGRAIAAAPAVGAQMQVVGRALEDGVVDAISKILIQPQQITG